MKIYNIVENVVRWIIAFLANRQQKVKVSDALSEWLEVRGMPQGPLRFLMNDDLPDMCNSTYVASPVRKPTRKA